MLLKKNKNNASVAKSGSGMGKKIRSAVAALLLAAVMISGCSPISSFADVHIIGDTDGDGEISAYDARIALRAAIGLDEKYGYERAFACDINHSGTISISDARFILRASVGLEDLSGHSFGDMTEEVPATVFTEGKRAIRCSCGAKKEITDSYPLGSVHGTKNICLDTTRERYTDKYSAEIKRYTASEPALSVVEREDPVTYSKIYAPRFTLQPDGYYRNTSAQASGKALLMFTGDLMCQTRQQLAAYEKYGKYDFCESFAAVRDIFGKADLVVGNLEATTCDSMPYMSEQKALDGKPYVNAPSSYLKALNYAGFDALIMANNHVCDTGVYGMFDTLGRVEEHRFMHTGTFSSPDERRFILVDVNGIKVAIMAYASYYNLRQKFFTEEGISDLLNFYEPKKVRSDVLAAREAGAEFIISYIHAGTEYTTTENATQTAMARYLAEVGVDCIIGSHPHVLQKINIIKTTNGRNVPVIYSMGNFVSHMTRDNTNDTVIFCMELTKTGSGVEITAQNYIPCYVFANFRNRNYIILPTSRELNGGITNSELDAAYERITAVMGNKITPAA